jgi:quercetin dioxygenase-like cupin family protein
MGTIAPDTQISTSYSDFETATLFDGENFYHIDDMPWNPHSVFKGVYLKHLIKGEKTNNQISCHLVKIEPGCEIGLHNHIGKTELHEVIEGYGDCITEGKGVHYKTGCVALVPADNNHKVTAGEKGLVLLAKFFPALV